MRDIDPGRIRKILVREVNWVGDAVLTLPALEALDRRFPEAEIVVVGRPWVAGLFGGQRSVDRVLAYESAGVHGGLAGRWALARRLRGEGFDLAMLFPNSFESAVVPWLAGIPHRVGYPTDGEPFTCAIGRAKLFAIQFHPEKSSSAGLRLLANFVSWDI